MSKHNVLRCVLTDCVCVCACCYSFGYTVQISLRFQIDTHPSFGDQTKTDRDKKKSHVICLTNEDPDRCIHMSVENQFLYKRVAIHFRWLMRQEKTDQILRGPTDLKRNSFIWRGLYFNNTALKGATEQCQFYVNTYCSF